jgi:hypothetical protein
VTTASTDTASTAEAKLPCHHNVTTTMNAYSHMMPDDFDALAKAMDKAARAATL